jgi:hypothetical protein
LNESILEETNTDTGLTTICLVGKASSGKTALIRALKTPPRLNMTEYLTPFTPIGASLKDEIDEIIFKDPNIRILDFGGNPVRFFYENSNDFSRNIT